MKVKILGLAIASTFVASANYNMIINTKDVDYDILKRWETVEKTAWTDVGGHYDCSVFTPSVSDVYIDTSFEQSNSCSQKQEQTETTYINYSDGRKIVKETKTNEQIISVSNKQNAIGTFKAKSCNEVLNSNGSTGTGNYSIYPDGSSLTAYCDMTTDGGGWTLVGRSRPTANARESACNGSLASYGSFGWIYSTGSLSNDNSAYSMGVLNKNLDFTQVLFGEYSSAKNFGNWVYKHNLSRSKLLSLNTTTQVIGYPSPVVGGNTGFGMAAQVGAIDKNHFFLRDSTAYSTYGLMEDGWYSCYGNGTTDTHSTPASFGGNINYKPGMIFVR